MKILRATTLVVAFCLSAIVPAQDSSIEETVKKAQKLLLNGQREKALSLIVAARKNSKVQEVESHLDKEGEKIATFFVSDEAQKLYELGESMNASNPILAEEKYKEALQLDVANLKIINALALMNLRRQNCHQSFSWVNQGMQYYPYFGTTKVILLQTLDCLDNSEAIVKLTSQWGETNTARKSSVFQIIHARQLIKSGDTEKGIGILKTLSSQENIVPEVWYWRWKLDPEGGKVQKRHLEKYVKLCKSVTPRLKRVYEEDGAFCLYFEDAEKVLNESGEITNDANGES